MGPGTVPKSQKASIHRIDPFSFVLLYVLQILRDSCEALARDAGRVTPSQEQQESLQHNICFIRMSFPKVGFAFFYILTCVTTSYLQQGSCSRSPVEAVICHESEAVSYGLFVLWQPGNLDKEQQNFVQ